MSVTAWLKYAYILKKKKENIQETPRYRTSLTDWDVDSLIRN